MVEERFKMPARLKTTGTVFLVIGIITLIIGGITLLGGDGYDQSRFWITLLLDSIYFLFLAVIAIFILAAAGLAQGDWITAYRRIPEAIGKNVWVFCVITFVVMMCCLFYNLPGHTHIYQWVGSKDPRLTGHTGHGVVAKNLFLNPVSYIIYTVVIFGLWSWFGIKFRNMSIKEESVAKNSTKLYWKMVVISALFMVVFGLSMGSVGPWMWIMSLQPFWFSTLFSWYVFASAFVAGMALVLLFVVYVKNAGYLGIVNKEHLHDLGKFMFAFSIFWTYLWFAQYLLIWYANIPEETTYFVMRQHGPYAFFFYANFIINFVLPILILMSNTSKRNYFTIVFMAILILFGHWIDFYLMIVPNIMKAHWHLSWFEFGVTFGFIGLMILVVMKTLSKANLVPMNSPLLKESIVHLS